MTSPRRQPTAEELPRSQTHSGDRAASNRPQISWNWEHRRKFKYINRPQQTDQRDIPESSKPKKRKRKAGDAITAAEGSRTPQSPYPDKIQKVMEALCPFHPKGKHAAKDCFALKKWLKEGRSPDPQ